MDIVESERVQLKLELLDDPHSPENCFIEQALSELLIREQLLIDVSTNNLNSYTKPFKNSKNNLCNTCFKGTPSLETEELQISQNDENIESRNHEDVSSINNNMNPKVKESLQLLDNDTCSTNDQTNNDLNLTSSDAEVSANSQKFYYFYQGTVFLFYRKN